MLALQGVVDVVGGGDVGLAAGERLGDAEEADEVCAVGVEVLSGRFRSVSGDGPFLRDADLVGAYLALVR